MAWDGEDRWRGVVALERSLFIVDIMFGSGRDAGRGVRIGAKTSSGRGGKDKTRSCKYCCD